MIEDNLFHVARALDVDVYDDSSHENRMICCCDLSAPISSWRTKIHLIKSHNNGDVILYKMEDLCKLCLAEGQLQENGPTMLLSLSFKPCPCGCHRTDGGEYTIFAEFSYGSK